MEDRDYLEEDMEELEEDIQEEEMEEQEAITPVTAIVEPKPLPKNLPWNMSKKTKDAVSVSRGIRSMDHGMLSGVPIICRTYQCPYQETCWIPESDRQFGERCPIEIGTILERTEHYHTSLNISDNIMDEIDRGLVREIVDIEIMMLRCDNLLATSGKLIDEVIATVDDDGNPYYKPEISKAFEIKERLRKERHRILNLLNSTRKDKKQQAEFTDPSSMVSNLMEKLRGLQGVKVGETVVDAEFTTVETKGEEDDE